MKNKLRILLVAFFSIFLLTGSALALTIDFGYAGLPGGTIYANSTNATGQNIPIDKLTVFGNGAQAPSVSTVDLVMNFAYTSIPNQNYITISSISNTAQGNWLSGSFSTFEVEVLSPVIKISASGPDTKAEWLLQRLGIPVDTQFQFFGFTIATSSSIANYNGYTGFYMGQAYSTDISNNAVPVPEPASMLLFGLGLIGLAAVRRKLK